MAKKTTIDSTDQSSLSQGKDETTPLYYYEKLSALWQKIEDNFSLEYRVGKKIKNLLDNMLTHLIELEKRVILCEDDKIIGEATNLLGLYDDMKALNKNFDKLALVLE